MNINNLTSLEAERAVLGAIMMKPDEIPIIRAKMPQGAFSAVENNLIYDEICRLDDLNQKVDPVTLGNKQGIDFIHVANIYETCVSTANAEAYADIVINKHKLRKLYNAAVQIKSMIASDVNLDEAIETASRLIDAVDNEQDALVDNATEACKKFLIKLEEAANSDGDIVGVPTGLTKLDERVLGYRPGNLIIIAARPAMGKTTLALNIAEKEVLDNNKTALVFSLEMPTDELIKKMVSSRGTIANNDLKTGYALQDEQSTSSLFAAISRIKESNLFICDKSAVSLQEIRSISLTTKRKHGLDLIVIDYLQLMKIRGDFREAGIAEISGGLKALAKELKIPIICLSQLNRKCEDRPDKRPMVSDLRESGAIEQDADIIHFIYRDEIYNENSQLKGVAEIITAKFREGEIGTDHVEWQGRYSRFKDLSFAIPDAQETTKTRGFN